jgi:tetratricopeptide (TPR) repeat protein
MSHKFLLIIILSTLVVSSCKKTNDHLFDEAYTLTQKGQFDKAIKKYSELLNRNDKLQLAYYNRGYCYYSEKKYDKALEDFNQIIYLQTGGGQFVFTLNNNSPYASEESRYQIPYDDVLYQRAQVYFYLEKSDESFKDFGDLIKKEYQEQGNCYLWQASIILNRGDTSLACPYFNNAKKFANNEATSREAERMLKACFQ